MPISPSFVAIDPGYAKRGGGCAVAWFEQGTLSSVYFERPDNWVYFGATLSFVLVEQPQYEGGTTGRSTRISPETLMRLSWEGALLAGLYAGAAGCKVIAKTPRQWKGNERKPQQHAALWAVLSEAERQVLGGARTGNVIEAACERGALKKGYEYPTAFVTHNLLDAAAMGCKHIGRLK